MNTNIIKTICATIAAAFASAAFATAPTSATQFTPKLMNYQGYLANPSTGAAYTDGIYQLECRLYRQASGGTAIWGGRYSVYVKGGYFNLMLGDTSATNLGYTYANNDLWRALWSDTAVAVASRNDLWLGVTPLQGPTGASISSPTEISPRQQLLAGPYAFRAQASEYANQSYSGFTVNGKLTVTGSLALPNSYSIPWMNVTSNATTTTVRIGGSSASSTANPSISNYARYLYNYSYYDMIFSPYAGNIKFTVPSGKSFQINNNNFAVTNATTTMKSSGTTGISGSSVTLTASSGNATLKSSSLNAYVEAPSASVYLLPKTNQCVYGKGFVMWNPPGVTTSTTYSRPMMLKTINVRNNVATLIASDAGASHYVYSVVGFERHQVGSTYDGAVECYTYLSNGKWYVKARWLGGSQEDTYNVQILGIHKAFVNDSRTW